MPIKAVVFDFGGVLLSYDKLDTLWLDIDIKYNLERGSVGKITKGPEFSAWLGPHRNLFKGLITIEEIEDGIFTEYINFMFGTNVEEKLKPLSPVLDPQLPHEYNHKMCSVVTQIREMGYKTALLTNNCHFDKERKLARLPFDLTKFDVVVESCLENLAKPEPEIYELTSSRLGLKPEELVFLDDLPENIETARRLGWHAIQVDTKDEHKAIAELEKLLEVQFTF